MSERTNSATASHTIRFELLTPERLVCQVEAVSAVLPGAQGSFGVLPEHTPFLTGLTAGEVRVTGVDSQSMTYAVSGGFVQVAGGQVVVLADTAERPDEIDIDRARRARERALERLSKAVDIDLTRARAALMRAENRLKLSGQH